MAPLSFFSPEQLLTGLGVLSVLWLSLKAAWSLAQGLRIHVLSHVWKGVDLTSYGPWAVVTGATNGIGKAYAHELARRGLNVVLISRSLEKLKQVASEIEEQHGRSTKVIQVDFTHGSEIYESIRAALQGLEVGILVNNVGFTQPGIRRFLDFDNTDKFIDDVVRCNMFSAVKMTQIVLPRMVARKKGIIINLSSTAGLRPFALQVMYSSSKTFVDFFSQALDIEYKSKGIIVQSILPAFVDTQINAEVPKFFKTSPESLCVAGLNTVGLTNRTAGTFSHAIQSNVLDMVYPEWTFPPQLLVEPLLLLHKVLEGEAERPKHREQLGQGLKTNPK
ncbi:very-long-chain 3-oxoacyl-CoA reductase-like [Heteronotia binoei]|uniref:very-long-chain 3-oxoacyl-CoA reductase-like n=1 Tax=Heteronotia binoei TaxID=13085 RepID=UPI0029308731|nr:very-long-chain 3-oxoacyl-CoA reductase-like [Heteronotia binoei]